MNLKISESMFDYTFCLYNYKNTTNNNHSSLPLIDEETGEIIRSDSSMYRAKAKILDYAKNNVFNYFFTQTFDDKKVDINKSYVLCRQLRQFFNNFQKRYDHDFKFILVAEYGSKSNRLHFHGLLYITNKDLLHRCTNQKFGTYYRFENLKNRFGSSQLRPIKDYSVECAYYISKYITKANSVNEFSSQYWCSRGLKTSKVLYDFDNQHNYCSFKLKDYSSYFFSIFSFAQNYGTSNDNPYCSIVRISKKDWPTVCALYHFDDFGNLPFEV